MASRGGKGSMYARISVTGKSIPARIRRMKGIQDEPLTMTNAFYLHRAMSSKRGQARRPGQATRFLSFLKVRMLIRAARFKSIFDMPGFGSIKNAIIRKTKENIDRGVDANGKPFAPHVKATANKILKNTAKMYNSLRVVKTKDGFKVMCLDYGVMHNQGTWRLPKRGFFAIKETVGMLRAFIGNQFHH